MNVQLKLRSFYFLVITVGLVAITIFLGRVVYSDLYRKILLTFDQKLLSASTVVAAFVSGEDHEEIVNLKQLRGIAMDRGQMYGRYAVAPDLEILNPAGRFGRDLTLSEEPYYTTDITFARGMVYAAGPEPAPSEEEPAAEQSEPNAESPDAQGNGIASESEDPQAEPDAAEEAEESSEEEETDPQYPIYYIDPRTGESGVFTSIGDACQAIAYLNDSLYCAGAQLLRIPLQNGKAGEPEFIRDLDFSTEEPTVLTGMTASADGAALLATDTNHFQILFLDPATGEVQKSLKLRSPGTEKAYPFGVFSLAYDEVTRSYFGVSTVSIVRIDMKTGEVQEVPGFGFGPAKSQSVYRELVAPMIRVRIGTKITYLYSAILVDRETHINYALDSTQSDIHSFVGIADSNPAEDNIRDVILKREIYLSDIQPWEDWGLLKSSYVPILNREGDAVAYAGADVDITIIESRTRLALLQVVIIGVVALAAGLAIAYFITERLTRPIHVLKQSALQVAAGDFGNEIHVSNPAELTRLSGSLTRLSRSLQETVTSLTGENYRLEEKRRRNELINLIYSLMKHKSAVDLVDGSRTRSQGIYEDARYLAVWIVPEGEDKLDSARLNSDLYRITRRLLQQSSEHYLESMEPFLGAMEFLMLLHKGSGQVEILNSADLDFYPVDDKKKSQRHSLKPGKHRIDSNGLAAVYVDWSDNRKDRAASLQGAARPRIREWAESAGHADRFLEVIL